MGLDLYSKIEPYLGFEDEIYSLHKLFLRFIMENDLDNILDIGCGQGYFLQNLQINQKKYLGVDLSSEQINACLEKGLNAKNLDIKDLNQKFDCIVAIFDVLNYIKKPDLKTFLENVSNLLNKDAYFLFDINTLYGFEEIAQGSINIDIEDKFIAIDAFFENSKLQTNITLFEKQGNNLFSKEQDSITQEYHSKEFLKELLEKSGFTIVDIKEFFLHSDEKADKLIFICKK
ncbi:class I SAM-dependent methyltransferase [Aliarcobacter skirrowii]|uniref:class I SAM-dependent DNA methyltransferase n=1 Tax=Aliarcobacter skirrowii TaxID=28200 RepID=UPI000F676988|nr:class I SAM-dependent methyltransferase [Aliarcobacter skirrowii]AZL54599.1 class I SAM-dependent methyltransferase [Aliarcobacter skirrowii]